MRSIANKLLLGLAASYATMSFATTEADYHKAVVDAAFPEESEIYDKLISVTPANPDLIWNSDKSKVLVTTWKAKGAYDTFIKPYKTTSDRPEYALWVTMAPQVQALCHSLLQDNPNTTKEQVDLRLKQYLGLSPAWTYDVFVEMWVDPADLFRPCVDPQINDSSCKLHFDDDSNPSVKNITDYREFYRNLYYKSYRASSGVPWTGLGYTFDWNSETSDVGASEFIITPGANYSIRLALPTMEYCSIK